MNEKVVIQFLQERRAGVSSYNKPVPHVPVYLSPDKPFAGEFVHLDGTPFQGSLPEGAEREEVIWIGCEPTTASRIPARRTKSSFRVRSNDRVDNREIVTESKTEDDFYLVMRAENRGSRIWDQPPARPYKHNEIERWHTFDFLIEEPDGRRIAYAVRRQEDVDEELRTAVRCVREQSLQGFADDAVIRTERFATKARVRNAIEILDAREARNEGDVQAALQFVSRIRGAVMLHDLIEALGLGPRGRNAILCLLDDGVLELVRKERLGPMTLLRPASKISITSGTGGQA